MSNECSGVAGGQGVQPTSDVPRHLLLGGGRFDQLTNYCYQKEGHRKYCSQLSLPAWLPFDQLFANLKILGERDATTPPN